MTVETVELTPEQITEIGKFWGPIYLSKLSVAERLAGLSSEERLMGLKPEERLVGLKPEEVLSYFKPEALLNKLSLEELESYLQQVKRNHSSSKTH